MPNLTDAQIEEILRSMQARVDDAWGAAPIDPATVVAAFTELAQLRASDKVMRAALEQAEQDIIGAGPSPTHYPYDDRFRLSHAAGRALITIRAALRPNTDGETNG